MRFFINRFTRGITFLFISIFIFVQAPAQNSIEDGLRHDYLKAGSDTSRIHALGFLADFYFANKNFIPGDSVIEKQIMLAEETVNEKFILAALFGNAGYNYTHTFTRDRLQSTRAYITRALNFAKSSGHIDYVALANANFAALFNADGKPDEAFKYAYLAFTTALNTSNDSAKVVCALELGNTYLQKSDILMAFKTYTNANEIASQPGNEPLQPIVFRHISVMYKKLGNKETAKSYLFRSLQINKKLNNIKGQVEDNISLAKLVEFGPAKDYLSEAIRLSENFKYFSLNIEARNILYSYMMLKEPPADNLRYLNEHSELKNFYINTGPNYLDWMIGGTYLWAGMPDSAIGYYKKAEASFNVGYDLVTKKNFFGDIAYCYKKIGNIPAAILYFEKTIELCRAVSDLNGIKSNAASLRDLFRQQGDYKKALEYGIRYDVYKDSVALLSKDNELTLLEIENEGKRIAREKELAIEKERRRNNLQYMGITIIVASIFLFLVIVGMFKVSKVTIRTMGFFSLIFLFEFIILVLDKWIHDITHGEPIKVWLIKIGIISILLPLHHYVEEKMINYLLSHHLIKVRGRISPRNWLRKQKKSSSAEPEEDDVSTQDILD